jgi:site-specific DNA recombinase
VTNNNEQLHVGIWIRVSTEDQVKGESPETHERRARAYAEAKSWIVAEVYRLDAVSGKNVKEHSEAKRMLVDVKAGRIKALIFSKLARLARNTMQLLEFSDFFRAHGADLVSIGESIDTSTPAGRLFFTMVAGMATFEREELSSRVAASVPIRAKMGRSTGGAAPFGYHWVNRQMVPHPDEAPVRVLMYELFKETGRRKAVARTLNERGYRTRGGAKFSDTTVERLLLDQTAKGIRRANYTKSDDSSKAWVKKDESEWVFHPVPAIVSDALWQECHDKIMGNRKAGVRTTKPVAHLFSGLVFCHCGTKMYVMVKSPKYTCQKCRNKMPIGDLEGIFEDELKKFVFSPKELTNQLEKGMADLQTKESLIETLTKEQKKLSGEVDKLHDLYQSSAIDKAGFASKYGQYAARLQQIADELPQVEAERDVLKISLISREEVTMEARDLFTRWPTLGLEEKRKIIETIVDRVVIHEEEVELKLHYRAA